MSSNMDFDDSATPGVIQRHGIKILPILLFIAYGIYYYYSNQDVVPVTGRKQLVEISQSQEMALGLQSYQSILSQSHIIASGPQAELVKSVGAKIAAVSDDPGFEWEYNLIDSPQANAFCLPGGKVAVYTGILPIVQNPDGLAIVMGHEIAHAIARHGAERMAHEKLAQLGQMAIGMSVSDMDPQKQRAVLGAFGLGAQFGLLLPFSREHESEADEIGLIYAARACFNPEEAPRLWERMAKMNSGRQPLEFMSTHPSNENRIQRLTALVPHALEEKAKYCNK
jgi:predicted Zn-dependent protease